MWIGIRKSKCYDQGKEVLKANRFKKNEIAEKTILKEWCLERNASAVTQHQTLKLSFKHLRPRNKL